MKLHIHLIESVAEALIEIFNLKRPADKVIEKILKKEKKWGARDRRFFAESTYEMVRWWYTLWFLKDPQAFQNSVSFPSSQSAWNLNLSALIELWGVYWIWKNPEEALPEDHYFDAFRTDDFITLWKQKMLLLKEAPRYIQESIPKDLDELGWNELGERWSSVLHHLNQPAPVDLRVNTLKTNTVSTMRELGRESIETEMIEKQADSLTLKVRKNVFVTQVFKKGWVEVQDRASQTIAPLVNPRPGMRVIDACAGAGGKTLHLAQLMKNQGRIIALDIHDWKLQELKKRARRAGIDIIETRLIESSKTIKRLHSTADRVLLDVPCSGLGVLRRNPDTKWKWTETQFQEILQLQRDLFFQYSKMVKPGGLLIYATCSVLSSENTRQVQYFLENSDKDEAKWKLVHEHSIFPNEGRGDGFYAAVLERKR